MDTTLETGATNKTILVAQLDSISENQIPEDITPNTIVQALRLYQSFHDLAMSNVGLELMKSVNNSIYCTSSQNSQDRGMFDSEGCRIDQHPKFSD